MPTIDGNILLGVAFDPASYSNAQRQLQNLSRRATVDLKVNHAPLGRINADLHEFDKSLQAANARVLAFGASTGAVYGIGRAFTEITKSFINIEAKFKSIQVVVKSTTDVFENFKGSIFAIGRDTGKSFDEVTDAAQELVRQGLKISETLQRTSDAMILSRQSGLSASEAVTSLTAALNTFNQEALTSTQVINKLANVDTNFAVSQKDLIDAISRSGSAAQDAGVQFDKLLSLTTSLQQTTARGGAVIGNALKSIFTRVQRGSTLEALEEFNIQTKDLQGNILSADRLLQNLANTYKTLSTAEKSALSEQVAGIQQINQLKALIGDLARANSVYSQALKTSSSSVNEAIDRNKSLNETLKATLNSTKLNALEFSETVGKLALAPALKLPLGSANALFNIFKDKDQDSKSMGQKIGEGILRGIGSVLSGPGLVLATAIITNTLKELGRFTFSVVSDYSSLNNKTKEQINIQHAISQILSDGNNKYAARLSAAKSIKEEEAAIRLIMLEQNNIVARKSAMYAQPVRNIVSSGGDVTREGAFKLPRKAASGYLPIQEEYSDIQRGVGGASRAAKPKVIPNFNFGGGKRGTIVANTDEYIVPNYRGGDGSAIFNPQMVARHGLPQGARKINAAAGYTPNFANYNLVHGSKNKFDQFDDSYIGGGGKHPSSSLGHFFSPNDKKANFYAKTLSKGSPGYLIDTDVNLDNPKIIPKSVLLRRQTKFAKLRQILQNKGHDGIIRDDLEEFIAFSAAQTNVRGVRNASSGFVPNYSPEFIIPPYRNGGMGGGSDIDWKSVLRFISPQQFLHAALPFDPTSSFSRSPERINKIRDRIQKNQEIDAPFLRFGHGKRGFPVVTGHEGRHRAFAAMMEGITDLPVEFNIADFGRVPSLVESGKLDTILSQKFLPESAYAYRKLDFGAGFERDAKPFHFDFKLGRNKGLSKYSGGFIPNFAKLLGSGGYGSFYDLNRKFKGVEVGKKVFHSNLGDFPEGVDSIKKAYTEKHITDEFIAAKVLENLSKSGQLPPNVSAPQIFGTLEGALKTKSIYKQVIRGSTGGDLSSRFQKEIEKKKNPSAEDWARSDGGEFFATNIASFLQNHLTSNLGLEAMDLHAGNYMMTPALSRQLGMFIATNPKKAKAIGGGSQEDFEKFFLPILKQKDNGLSIFDSGELRSGKDLRKMAGLAGGFIPNFADKLLRSEAIAKIMAAKNKMFGAEFTKRTTGESRTGTFRLARNVKAGKVGGSLPYNAKGHKLVPVFDMGLAKEQGAQGSYRMLPYEGLNKLNIDGKEYDIVDNMAGGFIPNFADNLLTDRSDYSRLEKLLGRAFGFNLVSAKDDDELKNLKLKGRTFDVTNNFNKSIQDGIEYDPIFSKKSVGNLLTQPRQLNIDKFKETKIATGLQESHKITDLFKAAGITPSADPILLKQQIQDLASSKFGKSNFIYKGVNGLQGNQVYPPEMFDLNAAAHYKDLFVQKGVSPSTGDDLSQFYNEYRVDVVGGRKGIFGSIPLLKQKRIMSGGKTMSGQPIFKSKFNQHLEKYNLDFLKNPIQAFRALKNAYSSIKSIDPKLRAGVNFGVDAFPDGIIELNPSNKFGVSGSAGGNLFSSLLIARGMRKASRENVNYFTRRGKDILNLTGLDQQKEFSKLNRELLNLQKYDQGGYLTVAKNLHNLGFGLTIGRGKQKEAFGGDRASNLFKKLGLAGGYIPNYANPNKNYLVHGTSDESIPDILKYGLEPRRKHSIFKILSEYEKDYHIEGKEIYLRMAEEQRDVLRNEEFADSFREKYFPKVPSRLNSVFLSSHSLPFRSKSLKVVPNKGSYIADLSQATEMVLARNLDQAEYYANEYFSKAKPYSKRNLSEVFSNRQIQEPEILSPGIIPPSRIRRIGAAGGYVPSFAAQIEKIRLAAIRHKKNGKIVEAPYHIQAFIEAAGATNNLDDNSWRNYISDYDQGFSTNLRDFIGRDEALKIAKKARQFNKSAREMSGRPYYQGLDTGELKFKYSGGYVPNFNNPLENAIERENNAGIPLSQIRVENHPSLISNLNPGGLAVTNLRDEPGGISQGISRARKEGRNPKTYGAANGLIPNFAPTVIPNPLFLERDIESLGNGTGARLHHTIRKNIIDFTKNLTLSKEDLLLPIKDLKDKVRAAVTQGLKLDPRFTSSQFDQGTEKLANYFVRSQKKAMQKAYQDNLKAGQDDYVRQELVGSVTDKINRQSGLFGGFRNNKVIKGIESSAEYLKLNDEAKLATSRELKNLAFDNAEKRKAKLQSQALTTSFGIPVLTGAALSQLNPNDPNSKKIAGIAEGVSTGLSVAAIGGFSPLAIGAGAILGGGSVVSSLAKSKRKSPEQLSEELTNARGRFEASRNAVLGTFQGQDTLKEAIEKGASLGQVRQLSRQITDSISGIEESSLRNKVIAAKTDEERASVIDEINKIDIQKVSRAGLSSKLEEVVGSNRGLLSDRTGRTKNIVLKPQDVKDIGSLVAGALPLKFDKEGKINQKQLAGLQELNKKGDFGIDEVEKVLGSLKISRESRNQLGQLTIGNQKAIAKDIVERQLSVASLGKSNEGLIKFNNLLLRVGKTLDTLSSNLDFKFKIQNINTAGIRDRAISGASQSLGGISEFLSPEARNKQESLISGKQIENQRISTINEAAIGWVQKLRDLENIVPEALKGSDADGSATGEGYSAKGEPLKREFREIFAKVVANASSDPVTASLNAAKELKELNSRLGKDKDPTGKLSKSINDFVNGLNKDVTVADTAAANSKAALAQTTKINELIISLQKSQNFLGGGTFESSKDLDFSKIQSSSRLRRQFKDDLTNPFKDRIYKSRGNSFDDFFQGKQIDDKAETARRASNLGTLASGILQLSQLGLLDKEGTQKARLEVAAAEKAQLENQLNNLEEIGQTTGDFDLLGSVRKARQSGIVNDAAAARSLKQVPLLAEEGGGDPLSKLAELAGPLGELSRNITGLNTNFQAGVQGDFIELSKQANAAAKELFDLSRAATLLKESTENEKQAKNQLDRNTKISQLNTEVSNRTQAVDILRDKIRKDAERKTGGNDIEFVRDRAKYQTIDYLPGKAGLGRLDIIDDISGGRVGRYTFKRILAKQGIDVKGKESQIEELIGATRAVSTPGSNFTSFNLAELLKKNFPGQESDVIEAILLNNGRNYSSDGGLDPVASNISNRLNEMVRTLYQFESQLKTTTDALNQSTQNLEQFQLSTPQENKSSGLIPNYSMGSSFLKEKRDIAKGVGGARPGDSPYMTHLAGVGPAVVNTGEQIIRNFAGGGKDAVINRKMMNFADGRLPGIYENGKRIDLSDNRAPGIYENGKLVKSSSVTPPTLPRLGITQAQLARYNVQQVFDTFHGRGDTLPKLPSDPRRSGIYEQGRAIYGSSPIEARFGNNAPRKNATSVLQSFMNKYGGGYATGGPLRTQPVSPARPTNITPTPFNKMSDYASNPDAQYADEFNPNLLKSGVGGYEKGNYRGLKDQDEYSRYISEQRSGLSGKDRIFGDSYNTKSKEFNRNFLKKGDDDYVSLRTKIDDGKSGGGPFQDSKIQGASGGLGSTSLQGSQRFGGSNLSPDQLERNFARTRSADTKRGGANIGVHGEAKQGDKGLKDSIDRLIQSNKETVAAINTKNKPAAEAKPGEAAKPEVAVKHDINVNVVVGGEVNTQDQRVKDIIAQETAQFKQNIENRVKALENKNAGLPPPPPAAIPTS